MIITYKKFYSLIRSSSSFNFLALLVFSRPY